MRAWLLVSLLAVLTLLPGSGKAENAAQIAGISDSAKSLGTDPSRKTYRGYLFDLTAIRERPDFATIVKGLRQQIDIVESVGLSHRVLQFFRTVPILVDEFACMDSMRLDEKDKKPVLAAGCYRSFSSEPLRSKPRGVSVWDYKNWRWSNADPIAQAEDSHIGVVMVRTHTIDPRRPLLLHEMLHAYHARIMPQGSGNAAIKSYYEAAKSEQLYPADAYLLTNEKEFFAVTTSVFLYGTSNRAPFTRSELKEKQPDYYRSLVWLFGFDPERAPRVSPVASAN